jgi:hypothetical protein
MCRLARVSPFSTPKRKEKRTVGAACCQLAVEKVVVVVVCLSREGAWRRILSWDLRKTRGQNGPAKPNNCCRNKKNVGTKRALHDRTIAAMNSLYLSCLEAGTGANWVRTNRTSAAVDNLPWKGHIPRRYQTYITKTTPSSFACLEGFRSHGPVVVVEGEGERWS